jgi:transcriptional regulator with XRE-family HTH domain
MITNLRLRLLEDGRPQYKIAAEVGVSPARISEYALGKRPIPTNHIYSLVRVLGCNVSDLIGFADDETIPDTLDFALYD